MQYSAAPSQNSSRSYPAKSRRADVPGLTGLRFVAALSVALAHGSELILKFDPPPRLMHWIPQLAGLGMSLFFVLSGFVIHYNYRLAVTQGGLKGLSGFVWARFSRLYPLYFLILVIDILLGRKLFEFVAGTSDAFTDVLHALPYYLTFTQSWFFVPIGETSLVYAVGGNSSLTWSISTEWFFYLSYPLVALLIIRTERPHITVMAALAWCAVWVLLVSVLAHNGAHIDGWAVDHYGPLAETAEDRNPDSFYRWLMYFSPYLRIGEFILGCLLAQLYMLLRYRVPSGREQIIGRLLLTLGVLSVPVLTYLMYGGNWEFVRKLNYNFGLAPSVALIIFCVARYDTPVSRLLDSRIFLALGEASYSIYLIHFLIFNLSASFLGDPLPATAANILFLAGKYLFLLTLIMVVSLGLHAFVEAPAKQWLRTLWQTGPRQRKPILAYAILATPGIAAALLLLATPPTATSAAVASGVRVLSATYGENCNAQAGNATKALSTRCNGRDGCDYIVDVNVLGDPAPRCAKNFTVEYECAPDHTQLTKHLPAEAGLKSRLRLSCPPELAANTETATTSAPPLPASTEIPTAIAAQHTTGQLNVVSATYGGNCGGPADNATRDLAANCNGKAACAYAVDVNRLGDPAPDCGKDFVASYSCAPDAPILRKKLPGEAGLGSVLTLSCRDGGKESIKP
jgi:peptidoglycan/LPS O-acetylase OafA/YrhL